MLFDINVDIFPEGGTAVPGKLAKYLWAVLCWALVIAALWLALRFLLPWLAPFLTALGAAALMEPAVGSMVRHGWRRSAAAGVVTLALLIAAAAGIYALASRGVAALTDFAKQVPELVAAAESTLSRLEARMLAYIAAAPESVRSYLENALDSLGDALYDLPSVLSQWGLGLVARTAQTSPDTLLFAVTAGIGTYFASASYPRLTAFLSAQIPDGVRRRFAGVGGDLKGSFGGWLRAQLILMLMTFFELLLGFLLLKIHGALLAAAVTAMIDALPVFGTGTVLVPWAIYCLLSGDVGRGVGLAVCWGVTNLVRSCAQAKLLGDQIGLDPLASLTAIYIGWRVKGVLGMLIFPLILVTLCQLNDRGVIKLWKQP